MSSKEVSLLGWYYAIPKLWRYPLFVLLVSIPFIIGVTLFEMSWLIPYQAIAVVTVIVIQLWSVKRSFNKCRTCGHDRHMHDKFDLKRKGFSSLSTVVCDDFQEGFTNDIPTNYRNLYWNGEDPRE